jgi:hypothetical protein
MPELTSSSAYDIKIESVLISSDRLSKEYEVAANVSEINIFENIDLPYMTGNILLIDSNELFTEIAFKGTEKVTIRIKINGDETAKAVEKKFIVTDIKVVPSHDTSEVMLLNIIEEHAYLSRLITVSKAYEGKPEEIIAKIFKDNLDLEILVPKEFQETSVQPMKVIIPNISPLEAVKWMKNRLVNAYGMPYFLYSCMSSEKIILVDLQYILNEEILNPNRSYSYGQGFQRWSTASDVTQQARNIESYKLPKSENMYGLAKAGALNSTYEFFDTVQDKGEELSQVVVNMEEILDRMESLGIITQDQRGAIYDEEFTLNNKTIAEYNPVVLTQLTPSNTFDTFSNYYESTDIEQQKNKVISRAIRYYLLKSPIEIVMPGFEFLGRNENNTIGRQIKLNFLKNNPDILAGDREPLDKIRSGKYIIYACRHIIQPQRYSVSLMCTKLANEDSTT